MDFSTFDTTERDRYAAEAKKKWGETDAYRGFSQKTSNKTKEQMDATGDKLMGIFAEFGTIRHLSPASEDAQALAAKLQSFITEHYYHCTKQILQGM